MANVIKADGTQEPFSEEKVISSMQRAGVPKELQKQLLENIKGKLYDNIQTWEIYQYIQEALSKSDQPYVKARYGLKQALMMLGPTGYPFEDFLAKVLEEEGYSTLVRQTIQGKCVTHEIDVVAEKEGKKTMIEAKFHNNPGARSNLQVAMYTKARFDDIKVKNDLDACWIMTNTKVTTDAIAYATCEGVTVIGWNYPQSGSLREIIETNNLHPITMLSSLSHGLKLKLLSEHIVLCRDICSNEKLIKSLNLPKSEREAFDREVSYVCSHKNHTHG